jgi:hypothetical protein
MRKAVIITLVGLLGVTAAYAQAAKSIYFEVGGPGLASFNYDTRLTNREDGIGGRLGVGALL